jgi:uncharacterized protein with von Willebrand factor type A (vWA) domain
MRQERPNRSAASIIEFCQFARSRGLPAGVQQTLVALEAAKSFGETDRQEFVFALRAALTSSKHEWDLFLELFETFWGAPGQTSQRSSRKAPEGDRHANEPEAGSQILSGPAIAEGSAAEEEGKSVAGASAQQRLQKMDFSNVPQDDLALLEEIASRLFHRMSSRLSRRFRICELAERVDIRRTIRRSIPRGGAPIVLAFQGRRPQKQRLVMFLDISGSMNSYSLFLVRFAYALQKQFKRVDTFLFSTEMMEITELLRRADFREAWRELSQKATGWAGGTKIGGSLKEFNRRYGRKLLSGSSVFIILSDGWDTGEPEVLAEELRWIRGRVQKVIWLNPLLGLAEYEPVTRGMTAALPYVDEFAPAHNLESLLALERIL